MVKKDKKINSSEYSYAVDQYSNAGEVFVSHDVDNNGSLTVSEFPRSPGLRLFPGDL